MNNKYRVLLVLFTLSFLLIILIFPIAILLIEAFRQGINEFFRALFTEYTLYALLLTMSITIVSVLCSTIFGIAGAWCMGHFQFRGKAFLTSVIDLPISISPIIIGLMFVIVYGKYGILGKYLEPHGIVIIFSWPGLLLTNMCISTPYVIRAILPIMQGLSAEQEKVAKLLGANGWQILFRITLPRIKWALLYGIILALARSTGEFGAASVVSGLIRKKTVTLPLLVEIYYNEYLSLSAFSCAVLFIFLAIITLVVKYYANKYNYTTIANTSKGLIT